MGRYNLHTQKAVWILNILKMKMCFEDIKFENCWIKGYILFSIKLLSEDLFRQAWLPFGFGHLDSRFKIQCELEIQPLMGNMVSMVLTNFVQLWPEVPFGIKCNWSEPDCLYSWFCRHKKPLELCVVRSTCHTDTALISHGFWWQQQKLTLANEAEKLFTKRILGALRIVRRMESQAWS